MVFSRSLCNLSIVAVLVFGPHNPAAAAESDNVEPSNLAACYADGIDMIGNWAKPKPERTAGDSVSPRI